MTDPGPHHRGSAANDRVVAATRAIEQMRIQLADPLQLADLARTAPFSPFHFHRLFREVTAMTPARFLAALRMAEARRLLLHSAYTVATISTQVGYTSVGTFTTQFTRLGGVSPAHFRHLARRLAEHPAGRLAVHVRRRTPDPGTAPLVRSSTADPADLVVFALNPFGAAADPLNPPALGRGSAPLPIPAPPGDYLARVLVVNPHVSLTEALVDELPGSYLTGAARVHVPADGRAAPLIDITARPPRATDPPALAVTSLCHLFGPEPGTLEDATPGSGLTA